MATRVRGALTHIEMVEVPEEILETAVAATPRGQYDNLISQFLDTGFRGIKVEFDGVKSQAVKMGLRKAIERAEKTERVTPGTLQVRTLDDNVYLVRLDLSKGK